MSTAQELALPLSILLSIAPFGCSGDDDGSPADGGHTADSGSPGVDAGGGEDAGSPGEDAGVAEDSGAPGDDAATPVDAGPPEVDAGSCAGEATGMACGDTADGGTCPLSYECNLGRCIPQGRETCGGFAGAPCPDTGHTECLYETGHGDVGTCFSPTEAACLCAVAAAMWSCP